MTKSTKTDGLAQRTYQMSERCRSILDQLSIVIPGYTKTQLVNFFIFWGALSIKKFGDDQGMDAKSAISNMDALLKSNEYQDLLNSIIGGLQVTKLDLMDVEHDPEDGRNN